MSVQSDKEELLLLEIDEKNKSIHDLEETTQLTLKYLQKHIEDAEDSVADLTEKVEALKSLIKKLMFHNNMLRESVNALGFRLEVTTDSNKAKDARIQEQAMLLDAKDAENEAMKAQIEALQFMLEQHQQTLMTPPPPHVKAERLLFAN